MQNNYIQCDEGVLHVISEGEAGKAVLLLCGAGLDNAFLSWKHLIPKLSTHYRVFAIDWPKQGYSSAWNGLADHNCLLKCIDTVLSHFELEKVSLVGLSQGGAMTLAYSILHHEKIEKIVALAPGGIIRFPIGVHQLLWLTAKLTRLTSSVSRFFFRNKKIATWSLKKMFPVLPHDFDNIVDDVLQEAERNGVKASDWQNHSIKLLKMNVYLRPELHHISCPTLFIQGDKDIGVNPKFTIEAANRVPNAKIVLLQNHGHWVNRQSPENVNRIILDFLTE